jgi:putative nucleotidyltransferase with HDIG domain
MKTILFVDDEPMVLQGLNRMLRPLRDEWETHFAQSAADGLELLEKREFDVVVSDIRMPGMDGAEFLAQVKKRYPTVVRIALSGHSERETIVKTLSATHTFLSKPCDPDTLKAVVTAACALRETLSSDHLRKVVSGLGALPSPSGISKELGRVLESPDVSTASIGAVVGKDPAVAAKILQMANSAFFGMRHRVSSIGQAVAVLGIDALKMLLSASEIFLTFGSKSLAPSETDQLYKHSLQVGTFAGKLATAEGLAAQQIEDAVAAGLLHDIGKLVLAWKSRADYLDSVKLAREKDISTWQAELGVFGATHADVGAYLLGLWGLPEAIVEATAFHHDPARAGTTSFAPHLAVHVADALDRASGRDPLDRYLDMAFLTTAHLADRLPEWQQLCHPDSESELPLSA